MNHDPFYPPGHPSDAYLARESLKKLSQEELLDYAIGATLNLSATCAKVGPDVSGLLAIAFYSADPQSLEALKKADKVREKLWGHLREIETAIKSSN